MHINNIPVILEGASDFVKFVIQLEINDSQVYMLS